MKNMEKENKDELTKILEEIDKTAERIESINVLFLDISSDCTGYAIHNINFKEKKSTLTKAGALWFNQKWDHQTKYIYMYYAISVYFWIVEKIDYIVIEQYSINPEKLMGVLVVPEMTGVIKCAAAENGIKVSSIYPQTWRSLLEIKRQKDESWKDAAKRKILEILNVPPKTVSNITGEKRNTPDDLYDAIGISIGWLTKIGINTIDLTKVEYNTHIGIIDNYINKEIQ